MKNFLIVVDMQKDFVDGALGTKEAQDIIQDVRSRILGYEGEILYTMDTHHENYLSTQEGGRLPVKHCIKGTEGWELNEEIRNAIQKRGALDPLHCVEKGAFASRELPERIQQLSEGEDQISFTLIGLCTDICVIANAMLLKAYFPEAPIYVDAQCCAGVTPESHSNALAAMKQCQISVVG